MPIKPLLLLLMFICVPGSTQHVKPECLQYEPVKVQLDGVVILRKFYGPPGFGEDPEHDQQSAAYILKLQKPICVSGSQGLGPSEDEFNIRELQLVLYDKSKQEFSPLRKYIGSRRKFIVAGQLFHQQTGHHLTKVLLSVDSIELSSP
jgi:hypothetical protein